MAANSIREQILLDLIQALEQIPGIRKVYRRMPVDEAHLARIPGHLLPCIMIAGGFPAPEKWGGQEVMSLLPVSLFLVGTLQTTTDEAISDLLDEVWKALMTDRKRGGLALATDLYPEPHGAYAGSYFRVSVTCRVRYLHTASML